MSKDKNDEDYEIGFGKPPEQTRFKPGESGNPKGRPRRSRNMRTLLQEGLKSKVTIREGDKMRKVSKAEAIAMKLLADAAAGKPAAVAKVLEYASEIAAEEERHGGSTTLTETDKDILDRYIQAVRLRGENDGT